MMNDTSKQWIIELLRVISDPTEHETAVFRAGWDAANTVIAQLRSELQKLDDEIERLEQELKSLKSLVKP